MVNISKKRNNIRCKMDGFAKYTIPYWALQSLIMFFFIWIWIPYNSIEPYLINNMYFEGIHKE